MNWPEYFFHGASSFACFFLDYEQAHGEQFLNIAYSGFKLSNILNNLSAPAR